MRYLKKDENDENNKAKISFNNKIELKNIEFSYDESKKKIFNNLNFEVKKILLLELLAQVEVVKLHSSTFL